MHQTILVVDDDPNIVEILEFNLKHEGYKVLCATSGEEALALLKDTPVHLLLLDVMMSGISGYKTAEAYRATGGNKPIIFLTARSSENDMLTGFSVGGDDYIRKPFSLKEVLARVQAVLRRSSTTTDSDTELVRLVFGEIEINLAAREVFLSGRPLALTKTETELMMHFATHPDRIFSRSDLIDTLWRETPFITERTVDVHIARLRKKLGERYSGVIVNRAGYGYKFTPSMVCD